MVDFLFKLAIPNYKDTGNSVVREKYGIFAGIVGIACNVILCIAKVIIGMLASSVSIIADGVNNLFDVASSLISLISFKISGKEPDEEHPFGHGRAEYIAGFILSVLIFMVGFELVQTSIDKIIHPTETIFSIPLVIVLILSIFVKLWMAYFNHKAGKAINSAVLMATKYDSLNDAISTAVVLISAIVSHLTSWIIDGYVGIFVAILIIKTGIDTAKDTLNPLLGQAADPEISRKIEELMLSYEDIIGVHDLIVHNYGANKIIASIHVEVADNCDFVAVHEKIDEAEKMALRKLGVGLVIHMDPVSFDDEKINKIRMQLLNVLHKIDSALSMHDFRIVDGDRNINLIFDVVVTYNYDSKAKELLIEDIKYMLGKIDKRYNCVITIDHKM